MGNTPSQLVPPMPADPANGWNKLQLPAHVQAVRRFVEDPLSCAGRPATLIAFMVPAVPIMIGASYMDVKLLNKMAVQAGKPPVASGFGSTWVQMTNIGIRHWSQVTLAFCLYYSLTCLADKYKFGVFDEPRFNRGAIAAVSVAIGCAPFGATTMLLGGFMGAICSPIIPTYEKLISGGAVDVEDVKPEDNGDKK